MPATMLSIKDDSKNIFFSDTKTGDAAHTGFSGHQCSTPEVRTDIRTLHGSAPSNHSGQNRRLEKAETAAIEIGAAAAQPSAACPNTSAAWYHRERAFPEASVSSVAARCAPQGRLPPISFRADRAAQRCLRQVPGTRTRYSSTRKGINYAIATRRKFPASRPRLFHS